MPPKAKAKAEDDDDLLDLMELEQSESSHRQDSSARAKFVAFLERIGHKRSFDQLRKHDIDKKLLGKFCSFMLEDEAISWQTSMNYFSSIRRQLETIPGVRLFKDEPEWYKKCRRNLHNKYVLRSIATGKPLKDQAPTMTFNDLVQLCTILFQRNSKQGLMDRTLLNNQWLAIGRSSDIGNLMYSDLHWHDHFLLIDLTRLKTRQQHSISIFCSPCQWAIDPFHSLASQLLADPYDASRKVFSQIGESQNEARIAAHINRVLRSTYDRDVGSYLTKGLQSHSTRRGGAAHASSHGDINLSDLAHRGLWSMDGFATLLEYISPTSASDQRIAKVLSGWRDPKRVGLPPSLHALRSEPNVAAFAQHMRSAFFAKLEHRGFADCLTATLLMYLEDTLRVTSEHIIHSQLIKIGSLHNAGLDELKQWGRSIKNQFVLDNIHSLPVETIKANLSDKERAAQHVSVNTFSESLERCLMGYAELTRELQELKTTVTRDIHDMKALITRDFQEVKMLVRVAVDRLHDVHSQQATGPVTDGDILLSTLSTPTPPVTALVLGRRWPPDFTSIRGMKLQDLVVRYVQDELSTVEFNTGIRLQKEVHLAMMIVKQFADLATIDGLRPASQSGEASIRFSNELSGFAREVQTVVVGFIEQRRKLEQTGKRKRTITGSVSGVVKAWGELSELDRGLVDRRKRVLFCTADLR